MAYFYLFLAICASAALSVMSTLFNRKNTTCKNVSIFYNLLVTFSAFCSWTIVFCFRPTFNVKVLGYSFLYAVFYTMALTGLFKALQYGSVALTAFVKQLSLIGVCIWGLLFWNSPFSMFVGIGLFLIVIALYFCFGHGKSNAVEKNASIGKWMFFALILLIGNAGCSIVQKYQQLAFDGKYGNALMVCGIGFSTIFCAVFFAISKKDDIKNLSPKTLLFPVVAGGSSAALNLFIILLMSSTLSISIIFVSIAVGGILLTTLFSLCVYKEKLKKAQWLGLVLGVIAVAFLNIG